MKDYRYRNQQIIGVHESSDKDCHLILEQSERIEELKLKIKEFITEYSDFIPGYTDPSKIEPSIWAENFKQLLNKG